MSPKSYLSIQRWLLIIIGLIAVGVGTVGIFVPLLPTTPFYLLAAACFFRSSDRLYQWLIGNKWCGPYIRNYREHRAIPRHAKIIALILLWGTIGHAVLAVLDHLWLRILLVAVAAGVTISSVDTSTDGNKNEKTSQSCSYWIIL